MCDSTKHNGLIAHCIFVPDKSCVNNRKRIWRVDNVLCDTRQGVAEFWQDLNQQQNRCMFYVDIDVKSDKKIRL